ncbi:response regulator transcription factor [Paenibacillus aceris]|uniref:YesN/AraC family two-component response regulator n=1 Tax=Paenibacillus aceris TaxID=869555 RepID=A0ABS4I3Y4_9BACL|nr:response regulator [Paenibacillus aceris]MBP1965231.1 YesN/AraC family two-component response regulator [Paenibacillus aceris]NHW33207.1 response regulator [Paenibacillus aceris]
MRRVIIVDDEKWIRRGLIQSISWNEWGLELTGEASDGGEGYEMALDKKPDLLFLDMRMPGLDGKQLLGMLSQELPDLLTIVISGYSDFEYTKEAIRHKAFDYLLKPVKKEELAAVVEKALQELDRREAEKRKASRVQGEDWLRQLLLHAEEGEEAFVPSNWQAGEYTLLLGRSDTFHEQFDFARLLPAIHEQLNRMKPFLFGGRWEYEVTILQESSKEIIIALCGARLELKDFSRLHASVQTALKQAGSVSFSFGMSTGKLEAAKLGEAYSEARKALSGKPLAAVNTLLFAEKNAGHLSGNYPQDKENAFLWVLQSGNKQAVEQEFERLFAAFVSDSTTVGHLQWCADLLLHAVEKQLQAKDVRLEEICGKSTLAYSELIHQRNDADAMKKIFKDDLLPAVLCFYSHSGEKQGEKVVGELKKWMESNYDQSLSLHQIASSYYLNPDYLSRIFKKMTGKNFVDYLTDIRMHKAKELMNKSKYKNYEVAQKVGYEDYRYFSQIFKRKVGMTIGEYRKDIGQADQ